MVFFFFWMDLILGFDIFLIGEKRVFLLLIFFFFGGFLFCDLVFFVVFLILSWH